MPRSSLLLFPKISLELAGIVWIREGEGGGGGGEGERGKSSPKLSPCWAPCSEDPVSSHKREAGLLFWEDGLGNKAGIHPSTGNCSRMSIEGENKSQPGHRMALVAFPLFLVLFKIANPSRSDPSTIRCLLPSFYAFKLSHLCIWRWISAGDNGNMQRGGRADNPLSPSHQYLCKYQIKTRKKKLF